MWYLAKYSQTGKPEFFTKGGSWSSSPTFAFPFKDKSRACAKQNQMIQSKRYKNEIRAIDEETLDRCRIELMLHGD